MIKAKATAQAIEAIAKAIELPVGRELRTAHGCMPAWLVAYGSFRCARLNAFWFVLTM